MTGLSVRGLTLQIADHGLLEDISFSAPSGGVTAVLGLAASGKTVLLAAIAGLLPLERGAVFAGGKDVTKRAARSRGIGFLRPGTGLSPGLSTAAALRRIAPRASIEKLPDLSGKFGLEAGRAERVRELTHGQGYACLALARSLPAGEILLVDEAGLGLDGPTLHAACEFWREQAASGRTVLLATRDAQVALRSDHLVLLAGGRVLQMGTPASLYAEPLTPGAALLTGPANIITGTIRQKEAGLFHWAAGGVRFRQAAAPGTPLPVLGQIVTLCLRPHAIALRAEVGGNSISGKVVRIACAGAVSEFVAETALGPLLVHSPGPATVRPGQDVALGWAEDAAYVFEPVACG